MCAAPLRQGRQREPASCAGACRGEGRNRRLPRRGLGSFFRRFVDVAACAGVGLCLATKVGMHARLDFDVSTLTTAQRSRRGLGAPLAALLASLLTPGCGDEDRTQVNTGVSGAGGQVGGGGSSGDAGSGGSGGNAGTS